MWYVFKNVDAFSSRVGVTFKTAKGRLRGQHVRIYYVTVLSRDGGSRGQSPDPITGPKATLYDDSGIFTCGGL